MKDSKLRCRCIGTHGCACTQAGKPVPVPASLPGRLAAAAPLTSAGRAGGAQRRVTTSATSQAQRQAVIDQFMRAQPAEVRAKFGSGRATVRKAAPRRGAAKPRLTDQLSSAWSATFTVGGWRQARALGDVMFDARTRGLGHDPATEPLVAAYTTAMGAGDVRAAELAYGRLVSHVRGLLDKDAAQALDRLAVAARGPERARRLIARRKANDVLRDLAVKEFGPERVGMLRLRAQVDRKRPQGGAA